MVQQKIELDPGQCNRRQAVEKHMKLLHSILTLEMCTGNRVFTQSQVAVQNLPEWLKGQASQHACSIQDCRRSRHGDGLGTYTSAGSQ